MPLDHEKVPPPDAVNEIVGVVQVSNVVAGFEILTTG